MRRILIWLAVAAATALAAPGSSVAGELAIEVDEAVPFTAADLFSEILYEMLIFD